MRFCTYPNTKQDHHLSTKSRSVRLTAGQSLETLTAGRHQTIIECLHCCDKMRLCHLLMQLKHTDGMKQQGDTNIGCKPCNPQLLPDRQAIKSFSVRHEKHLEHCCMLSMDREHGTSPADTDSANDCNIHAAGMTQQCTPVIRSAIFKQSNTNGRHAKLMGFGTELGSYATGRKLSS